jgi:hypothetical protein
MRGWKIALFIGAGLVHGCSVEVAPATPLVSPKDGGGTDAPASDGASTLDAQRETAAGDGTGDADVCRRPKVSAEDACRFCPGAPCQGTTTICTDSYFSTEGPAVSTCVCVFGHAACCHERGSPATNFDCDYGGFPEVECSPIDSPPREGEPCSPEPIACNYLPRPCCDEGLMHAYCNGTKWVFGACSSRTESCGDSGVSDAPREPPG